MLDGNTTLPSIVTPRLALRWLTVADVDALYEVFGDVEVCRFWSHPALPERAAARALLAEIQDAFGERSLFQWGLALRADDRVIGTCTLSNFSIAHRRAELGYALGRAHWKQGYMAEALPALLRFAFSVLNLHRVEADVDPRNVASIRSLERLGFRREGLARERYHLNGEIQDALLYALLRHELVAAGG